jgi:hypothetical protein
MRIEWREGTRMEMEMEDGDGEKLCFACLLVRAGARFVFGSNGLFVGLVFADAIVAIVGDTINAHHPRQLL